MRGNPMPTAPHEAGETHALAADDPKIPDGSVNDSHVAGDTDNERPATELRVREMAVSKPSPSSINGQERTVEAVISAGSPVNRTSRDGDYVETLSMEANHIRLGRLNNGAPLLDSHDYWGGTRAIL